ncbi:MAG: hypothetical protein QHH05_08760 [Syntrophomonadaceae bacterium]|jgi:hypothetical protein|nr:hypothetical protein [Syntrophomonadaceae bacterium]MDH7498517.1 hypothetical protein [Syntrophomonadaceae bacterium]
MAEGETDRTLEIMRQVIEEKKRKSASQRSGAPGKGPAGSAHPGMKKRKKGGLSPK